NFGSIQKELEKRKLEITSSDFEREAINLKDLDEEKMIKVEKLINMIDEDEDIQNVYHNMKSEN
ncbi:MAG: YebC/PmpR family DNA-binding transcriptional regulator, partial [Cryomorphaceae bacterium]|nr:YebC/PmpR family DNA-binding transcriptional regulator [Cryomorphaceae bacterium]